MQEESQLSSRPTLMPKGISGAALKYIAAAIMFIDHLTCCFLEVARGANGRLMLYNIPHGKILDQIGRGIGRTAFPIFCFFLVEGFLRTRSRFRYLGNLIIFGLVSELPFLLCIYGTTQKLRLDTMFELAIGLLTIWGLEKVFLLTDRPAIRYPACLAVIVCGCAVAHFLHTDYREGGIATIAVLYLLRYRRDLSLPASWTLLTFYNQNEIWAFPAFLLLDRYNGQRGRQSKYFFYCFYPGHLLLLYLIRRAAFGA